MLKDMADHNYEDMDMKSVNVTIDATFYSREDGEKYKETYYFSLEDGGWSSIETSSATKSVLQFSEYKKERRKEKFNDWETVEQYTWDEAIGMPVDLPTNVIQDVSERLDVQLLIVE